MQAIKQLKKVLTANAIFSSLCAVSLFLFRTQLSELMNIPNMFVFTIIGIGLLLFVGLLVFTIRRSPINKILVKSIIIQDGIWVFGSCLIVILQAFNISFTGYLLITIIAIIVGVFGYWQKQLLNTL